LASTVSAALAQSGLVPLDAQVLLAHVVGKDRAWLVAHGADALAREQWAAFMALARRRQDGEPVAYLTGAREFWGLRLRVTPEVLIPRPETETLVELALARLPIDRDLRVLDLGTGSGAIALAIAHERPRTRVLATDVSSDALDVARDNANALGLRNVEFLKSDWYDRVTLEWHGGAFDLIASNPPYIAAADPHLDQGDVRFEPRTRVDAGRRWSGAHQEDRRRRVGAFGRGRNACRRARLRPVDAVRAIVRAAGFANVVAQRDLAGIPRVAAGVAPLAPRY
jgi:release factor glutamine methyltransferase